MNGLTELYKIAGQPMLAPDADVVMQLTDLDSSDAGRDESGYMHRFVVRNKVGTWEFSYAHLTAAEYAYMLSILPAAGTFVFTYPAPVTGAAAQCQAYLSNYGIVWHNQKTGHYKNLKFSIIEC